MNYKKNLSVLFSNIINGYNNNVKVIKLPKNKFLFFILNFLYKKGYIYGFYLNKNLFFIELKYKLNGYKFINFFKTFNILHKKTYFSLKKLRRNYRHSNFYVLNTHKGILLGYDAVFHKIGGLVL